MEFKMPNAERKPVTLATPVLAAMCLVTPACGGTAPAGASADAEVLGVYTNPEGNASVEFMSGGRAHFSLHGIGGECTSSQEGLTVRLTCEGATTEFTVEDDGALKGPPDSFLTRMKKKT